MDKNIMTKKKAFLLLACIWFIITFTVIQTTYAKYVTNLDANANIAISYWNILVNNQDISENPDISAVMTAVLPGSEYAKPDVLVPGSLGYFDIQKIISSKNWDVIWTNEPVMGAVTRIAASRARRKGTKVVYMVHGFHFYQGAPLKNWLLYYPVERLLAHLTDVLITINREDYERAKKFKAGKVYYVPGVGIDLNKFNTAAILGYDSVLACAKR